HSQFFQLATLSLLVPCVQSARSARSRLCASHRQPHFLERPFDPADRLQAALFHCTARLASPPSILVVRSRPGRSVGSASQWCDRLCATADRKTSTSL